MNIAEQLTDIYLNKEYWHKDKLTREESLDYFNNMINKNNIIYYEEDGRVIGYVEFWRITMDQLRRLCLDYPFKAEEENTNSGPVAYIANGFIEKEFRHSKVVKYLKDIYYKINSGCRYFCEISRKKGSPQLKMFKFKGGDSNGK